MVQFSFKVVGDACEDENLDAAPSVDVVEWLDPVDPVQLGTQGRRWALEFARDLS